MKLASDSKRPLESCTTKNIPVDFEIEIAVLIPCFNEEKAIGQVVKAFRAELPSARIYVYDNNSTDRTIEVAAAAGAMIGNENQQGKGHVVRRMFSDIDADVYVLVDGDNTYQASAALRMIETLVENSLDMVTGCRVSATKEAYPPGHRFGNWLMTTLVSLIFGRRTKDMLSGYRVFSRRFVKSFPALSRGFEIETELTVHTLELRMPIVDIDTDYVDRPVGSESKLSTIRDGIRILIMIFNLVREERPLLFFAAVSLLLSGMSFFLGYPIVVEYLSTGLVPRLPTAVLSSAIMIISVLSILAGLILDTVTHGRREMKRLNYLRFESPGSLKSAAVHRRA
jgi:glycosyltransferase involved in cell wall biosynthesis